LWGRRSALAEQSLQGFKERKTELNKLSIYVAMLKKSGLGKSCGFRAELDPSFSFPRIGLC